MATVSEGLYINNLIWSNTEYSLAEFVEKFQLPQVVRVETGYYNGNDRTSLASGQVVTLHCVRKIKNVVCRTLGNKEVAIPYNCPQKCVVQDSKCAKVSAYQLSVLFDQVKYILTLGGYHNAVSPANSFREGEILNIISIDTERRSLVCQSTASTMKKVQIPFDCTAMFCSLLDLNEYTLAEVEQNFALPIRVRFLRKELDAPRDVNYFSVDSNLREVSVLETLEQTAVVLTVVCENLHDTDVCLEITKDIPVQVAVAQEFLESDDVYTRVVKKLDRGFKASKKFDKSGIYENMVKATTPDEGASFEFESASLPQNDQEFRRRAFQMGLQQPSSRPRRYLSWREVGSGPQPIPKPRLVSLLRDAESAERVKDRSVSDEELIYVDVIDLKSKTQLRKSDSEVKDYTRPGNNAENAGEMPEHAQMRDKKNEPVTRKPPVISKESILNEIKRRGENRIENKSGQTLNKPQLNLEKRNKTRSNPVPIQPAPRKNLPGPAVTPTISSTWTKNMLYQQSSLQAKTAEAEQHATNEVYEELVHSPLVPSLSPVECSIVTAPTIAENLSSTRKPPVISKESILNEIKRRENHIENKSDQTLNKPQLNLEKRNKIPPSNLVPIQPAPRKNLPGAVTPTISTWTDNMLYRQSSPQAKTSNAEQHTTSEMCEELVHSPFVPSLSPVECSIVTASTIPETLSGLSVKDVAKILTILDLQSYTEVFQQELIDGDMLISMDKESLESLGMIPFHVKRLMRFIQPGDLKTRKRLGIVVG